MYRGTRRSFTLLELMVAFVVLAILSAVAVPVLSGIATNDRLIGDQATASAIAENAYLTAFHWRCPG